MLNYLSAELWRMTRRRLDLIWCAAYLLLVGVVALSWTGAPLHQTMEGFRDFLVIGLYLGYPLAALADGEARRLGTLRNEVSYGLSRGRIYLGKLLVSTGIAVLAAVVMMGFYLGLCWVLFPHTELDGMAWQLIGYCLAGAFPLWLAAQAMVNTCYFLVRGTNIAAFTAAGLLAVLPAILQAFGILFHPAFEVLRQFMPGVMLENLKNMAFQWNYVGLCWAAGLAWLAAATAVGLLAFRRKEIR